MPDVANNIPQSDIVVFWDSTALPPSVADVDVMFVAVNVVNIVTELIPDTCDPYAVPEEFIA